VLVFGVALTYAAVAMIMGLRLFWRDIGEPMVTLTEPHSVWATAFTHRVLRGWGFGASPARQVVGREERAMEGLRLGRFGDRRLEKGGPSFWSDWCRRPAGACACAGWAGAAPGRCV